MQERSHDLLQNEVMEIYKNIQRCDVDNILIRLKENEANIEEIMSTSISSADNANIVQVILSKMHEMRHDMVSFNSLYICFCDIRENFPKNLHSDDADKFGNTALHKVFWYTICQSEDENGELVSQLFGHLAHGLMNELEVEQYQRLLTASNAANETFMTYLRGEFNDAMPSLAKPGEHIQPVFLKRLQVEMEPYISYYEEKIPQLPLETPLQRDEKIIRSYVTYYTKDLFPDGGWVLLSRDNSQRKDIEMGIGNFRKLPAIADQKYQVNVGPGTIQVLSKPYYIEIESVELKKEVLSKFAQCLTTVYKDPKTFIARNTSAAFFERKMEPLSTTLTKLIGNLKSIDLGKNKENFEILAQCFEQENKSEMTEETALKFVALFVGLAKSAQNGYITHYTESYLSKDLKRKSEHYNDAVSSLYNNVIPSAAAAASSAEPMMEPLTVETIRSFLNKRSSPELG